jgi:ABC-type phosphate/phosphonate transport system ATPase subunit
MALLKSKASRLRTIKDSMDTAKQLLDSNPVAELDYTTAKTIARQLQTAAEEAFILAGVLDGEAN